MSAPRVELLWWSGCPSHDKAREILEEVMAEAGLHPAGLQMVQVVTDQEATRERFIGSPTIRIDGRDVVPDDATPTALTCRLYYRRDGRPSPLPDRADLRDALAAAMSRP
jgi:hypothetical protein